MLGDPTGRLLRLDVWFGAELPCEGETPSRDVLMLPCDVLSRALCAICLGVAASLSMTEGNERRGTSIGWCVRIVVPYSKVVQRIVKG